MQEIPITYTHFFYKKLSSGNEYSVSYENGFFRVLSFFAVSYPTAIGAIFVQKYESFLEKSLDSFLWTWNMSTRFLNSEIIWVLVSYKTVSYKKTCVYGDTFYCAVLKVKCIKMYKNSHANLEYAMFMFICLFHYKYHVSTIYSQRKRLPLSCQK